MQQLNIILTTAQQSRHDQLESIVLKGNDMVCLMPREPGTGTKTLLSVMVRNLEAQALRVKVLASTGLTAFRLKNRMQHVMTGAKAYLRAVASADAPLAKEDCIVLLEAEEVPLEELKALKARCTTLILATEADHHYLIDAQPGWDQLTVLPPLTEIIRQPYKLAD